jgi:hypothetical protein
MALFQTAEAEVKALIAQEPVSVQDPILEEWNKLKERQAGLYIAFFEIEDSLMQKYEELMTLYYNKREELSYDMASGKLSFKAPEDEAIAETIKSQIKDLYMQETDLLSAQ